MDKYNPEYVEKLVKALMNKADNVTFFRSALAAFFGFTGGLFLGNLYYINSEVVILALVGAVVIGAFGYFSGQFTALRIRAEAQLLLTQLEIEKNTRPLRNVGKKRAPQQS